VLTCVGSLSQARLRLAGGTDHATWQGPFEILALTGTLSQDGSHLHLAVADHQGRTFGSHLAEGCTVRTTAEVILAADDRLVFAREHDPVTRLRRAGGPPARPVRPGTATGSCRSRGSIGPGHNRLMAARAREAAAGLTGSRSKTHAEFRPAGATRCHSLLLAGAAILHCDLHECLFLLVTA
jgi:hypothetical protein